MSAPAPAASAALDILELLASRGEPVPATSIARSLGLPRSSVYHLLSVLTARGYVTHLPDERRYGLGIAAYELGSAFQRQEGLARLARLPLDRLVSATGHNAHLAILHGRDVLYVVEERAPGRPPLVSDVGVRLPAHLTASGRAILADPPDILLTNYVMLELVLTRPDERAHLIRAAKGLRFLVLDELHTYRGRQGADVALLVRRLRDVCDTQRHVVMPGVSRPGAGSST